MRQKVLRVCYLSAFSAMAIAMITGCGSRNSLPSTVTVELPDNSEAQVTLGAGVLSLANSTWEFFATSGSAQGLPFVTITFGPDGNLEAFEDSTIIPQEIFGPTILFDQQRHNTAQPGLTYEAGVGGAETSDASGFAFVGILNAYAPVLGKVATATATTSGTFDADDPDVMTGMFSYEIDVLVNFPGIPADTQDEFSYIAHRVSTE